MAGIYIHIPFCRQACHYCNFHFSTSLKLQNGFLDALLKEIALRSNYIGDEQVETIYFGGGTPSLLPKFHLELIMNAISKTFSVSSNAEVTFEANPDDIHKVSLQDWKQAGINRLSIGVQSFFEEDLLWMNRAHTAAEAAICIRLAQEAGFDNMSIDLIYGTPGLTDDKWEQNMQTAADLGIPHLSCYALTVETGTPLYAMTRKKKVQAVSNEDQARQFLLMSDFFQSKGYAHYEISNLCLPGKKSVHNSSYWNGAKYLGLGPSAHSFNGHSRQWNISNNAVYIQLLNSPGTAAFSGLPENIPVLAEIETLSETQRFNEYIMTALRKMEGVDIDFTKNQFSAKYAEELLTGSRKYVQQRWIENIPGKLILTREGKLFADQIASELFSV